MKGYKMQQLLITFEDKYFDLTMIYVQLTPKSRPMYTYYLPFEGIFYEEILTQKSTLYPDKLKNLKGYEFTIADEFYRSPNIVAYEESHRLRKDFLLNPGH